MEAPRSVVVDRHGVEHHIDHHIGATEDQVDMRDTIPQRIDKQGHKLEDIGGTGKHDSQGG